MLTPTQEKQIAFLDKQEAFESLTRLANYDVRCRDCKESIFCHAADTVKHFIYNHAGHYTWVTYMGKTRS